MRPTQLVFHAILILRKACDQPISVGCATLRADRTIDLRKDVGKVDDVAARLDFAAMTGQRGIVQLRWATFGVPSQINAQPHLDSAGGMVGAHNGNVVNNV